MSGVGPSNRVLSQLRDLGSASAAVVLNLLLLDAAVETFLVGSQLRWILVLAVVAHFTLLAVLWRRLGWTTKSIISFFVLLGLLAFTAWRPGGLTSGVVLLHQPTSTVLASVVATFILVWGIGLIRLGHLPVAVRAALGALALYGAVAFSLGALEGTPYPDLFRGQSFWRRLPFWLQGAYVGAAVLLPAAFLIQMAIGIRSIRGPRLRVWGLQMLALGMSLAVALAGMASPPGSVPTPHSRVPESAALSWSPEGTPEAYRAALARLRDGIDFSGLDPRALQARLGADPRAIARYVQDEVRFESYAGSLRGPTGTLLAGAGNSLDRARLLATLLQAAGHQVRFATGTLSPGQAEELVRSGFGPPRSPSSHQPLIDAVFERSASHFILLGDALDAAGFKPPSGSSRQWQQAVRDAQEHAWVQLSGQGRWVDIDPSPGVGFGRSLVPAQRVLEALDERSFYKVEIILEVEVSKEDRRARETVLTFRASTAELAGISVGLFHEVTEGQAVPFLLVGDRLFKGNSFDIGADQQPSGGLLRLPGVGPGQEIRTIVTGEWLHVRVIGPAGERVATYTILDTLGPAARHSGSQWQGSTATRDALEGVLAIGFITGRIPTTLPIALLSGVRDPLSKVGLARLLATTSFGYAALRGLMPTSPGEPLPTVYFDSPNIVISHARIAREGSMATVALDLALKAYRILRLPEDPLATQLLFFDYLYNGALDHTVERALFAAQPTDTSVGALFEAAAEEDIAIQVLSREGSDPGIGLTADGKFRVSATLRAGSMVLLPGSRPKGWPEGRLGWWSVDPVTGRTEDTTETGCHQAGSERAVLEKKTGPKIEAVCHLAGSVFGIFLTLAASLHTLDPRLEWVADLLDAVNEMLEGRGKGAEYVGRKCGRGLRTPVKPSKIGLAPAKGLPSAESMGRRLWLPYRQPGRR